MRSIIDLEILVSHLKQLGTIVFEVFGDNITINELAAITPHRPRSLCYYLGDNPEVLSGLEQSIVICKFGFNHRINSKNSYIITDKPQLIFYYLTSLFTHPNAGGKSVNSMIDGSADIGENVEIGPYCSIGSCKIGDNVIIESCVKIERGTVIGDNVHVQSNTVIGASGVMWAWGEHGNKVDCAQTGNVIVGDNVFIGTNVSIVKGAFGNRPTIVGPGTKIAHGTMIGHGVVIGSHNHFANNVAIAGSVVTGKNCFFGSGVSVRPHITLGDDIVVGTGAVVVKDFEEKGVTLVGNPAKKLLAKKQVQSGVPAPFD